MKKLSVLSIAFALVASAGSVFAQPVNPAPEGARHACAGRHGPRGERQAAEASGTIARFVEGREGRVRGFALADGTLVRTRGAADVLRVGQAVRVTGFTRGDAQPRMIFRATVRDASGNVLVEPPARGEGRGHGWHRGRGAQPDAR